MFSLGIEVGSETKGCGFHSVNNWLVRVTCDLISLVNVNHMDNNLKEILVYVYFGSIVNHLPKNNPVLLIQLSFIWRFEKKLTAYLLTILLDSYQIFI